MCEERDLQNDGRTKKELVDALLQWVRSILAQLILLLLTVVLARTARSRELCFFSGLRRFDGLDSFERFNRNCSRYPQDCSTRRSFACISKDFKKHSSPHARSTSDQSRETSISQSFEREGTSRGCQRSRPRESPATRQGDPS